MSPASYGPPFGTAVVPGRIACSANPELGLVHVKTMSMMRDEKKLIQSVERAYRILKCFEEHEMLRIVDISNMLSLHKSTTFGLVDTLVQLNLLEQDEETGMYKLGMELFRLGMRVNFNLKKIVSPYIDRLVIETKETSNFVVRKGTNIVYVLKKESPHSMRICTKLGLELPMYCTAVGKAILAHLEDEVIDEIIDKTEFKKFTNNTITDVGELKRELEQIRALGYAVDNEELEYGLTCVAAPIIDCRGTTLGGISVSGPTVRMDYKKIKYVSELLMKYAEEIKAKL